MCPYGVTYSKQFQSNDDSEYLYMAKGNSPTAAEIIGQTKHHDTQRYM